MSSSRRCSAPSGVEPTQLLLELEATPRVTGRAAELVMREASCCSLFIFTLTATDERLGSRTCQDLAELACRVNQEPGGLACTTTQFNVNLVRPVTARTGRLRGTEPRPTSGGPSAPSRPGRSGSTLANSAPRHHDLRDLSDPPTSCGLEGYGQCRPLETGSGDDEQCRSAGSHGNILPSGPRRDRAS
jgi:hypothetical protein